jgi:Domain of unknown function DUF29
MSVPDLYETYFYAWTQEQVNLLKTQQWHQLDTTHLIEEIETLGRKERQELRNRLGVLLGHLLKWQFQSEKRRSSWLSTIQEQRIQIKLLLQDNPSLKSYLDEFFLASYELGLALVIRETQLGERIFPETCPYRSDEVLCPIFYQIALNQIPGIFRKCRGSMSHKCLPIVGLNDRFSKTILEKNEGLA